MIGLLVILVVSWMLLHFIEKKSIEVLGILPKRNRIAQFLLGVLLIVCINLIMIYIETLVKSISWQYKNINYSLILNAFLYHLRSALTEDLVFRGALLYILINRLGAKQAILIAAFFFGIYHVFSYGMIGSGRIIPILYVILITGFTGYVWAYIFYKTKSIYLGLGLHLGYNLLIACFYQSQPYGELIFSMISENKLYGWNEFYFSIFKGLFPSIVTLVCVKLFFRVTLGENRNN